MTTPDTFAHIPLAHIVASRTNPRKHFNPVKLHELAESIRASGVHTPVLVRPLPGHRVEDTAYLDPRPQWELVSGERRYRASEKAGATTITAMVRALTDDQVLEIQLVENLQRDDLTPLEEAEGYEALMQAHEPPLTAEQIGQRIGKSRSYVYGRLKLLNLGPEGRQALEEGWLEPSTALLVARMPSQEGCKELCKLLDLGKVAPAEAVRDWITNHDDPDRALALMLMYQDREWQAWKGPDAEHNARLLALATDTGIDVDVEAIKAQVKKEHTAEIRARNKVQADKAAADHAKASAPLAPAAQLNGGRGKAGTKGAKGGKGKNAPAAQAPLLSAGEAMQGIAAAMQSDEAGGDCAPGGADPAGGDAAGADEGRATSPDAGAALLVPGARVRLVSDAMAGRLATVQKAHTLEGKWLVLIDGLSAEYVFDTHELELLAEAEKLDASIAWPFPKRKEGSA